MASETMLKNVAAILIQAGQEIILPAYTSSIQTTFKTDGSIVTETDMACQKFIERELLKIDHNIKFLGEEMSESEHISCLQQQESFWCLDPLDGTTNFATGLPGFAISLALIKNRYVEMACIHDPIRKETFTALAGGGAFLNEHSIHCSSDNTLSNSIGFIDFKRLEKEAATCLVSEKSYRSQRNIGSCALEWAWLATGRGQFIIHGGEKIWDYAAGSLLVDEAGGATGDFLGRSLFPKCDLCSPILATCNIAIREKLKLQLNQ